MIELTRRAFLIAAAASLALFGDDTSLRRTTKRIQVAGTEVRLITIEGKHGLTYFHPHESEHASAAVARAVVRERGGRLLEIQSRGGRLISFVLNGATYTFDPNRMFSDEGLEKTLTHYGRYAPAAADAVKPLRNAVLSYLRRPGGTVIGVGSNAVNGMNIGAYQGSAQFAHEAARVAVGDKARKHNFFVATDETLFANLKHGGFNVVLRTTAGDDGSLSVYCQRNGLRYVNVEAAEGHTDEQRRMLDALLRLLK